MITASFDRIPVILQFEEGTKFTETYGFAGTQGFVNLEGQCLDAAATRG